MAAKKKAQIQSPEQQAFLRHVAAINRQAAAIEAGNAIARERLSLDREMIARDFEWAAARRKNDIEGWAEMAKFRERRKAQEVKSA